jgi:hypothetical protein
MSQHKSQVCGYEVSVPVREYRDLPMVRLHKLGNAEMGFFTPAEARVLATALIEAASIAEKKS